ncbi:MAG TPA: endonuclease NucS [Saprospiraceae bacterium]|nr:endonuclease NucS [Saprospiraceae bacterium]
MNTILIKESAIENLYSKLSSFAWTYEDQKEREALRQSFTFNYDREKIGYLTIEDYFTGLGRKQGCMAYDLEWGTIKLGSIKGGSNYKYGYQTDFPKIKILIQKLTSIHEKTAYNADGKISDELKSIVKLSKELNGFKTGRTVLPKLLSIYYPQTFLPVFNDQDHFLSILIEGEFFSEYAGLEMYLEYNYLLSKVKSRLEELANKTFDSLEFYTLLYHAFPKSDLKYLGDEVPIETTIEEQKFDALEVQHYQTLLHRNFSRLFPKLRYFDEEQQNVKHGQYDTQTVGIMDILAVDEKGDFVVIELKRSATDKTIGQVLRYMGWTQEELCKEGQKVKGLVVAERKDNYLEFALKVIPNVKFIKMGLSIILEEQ